MTEEKYQIPGRGHIFVCSIKTREECYRKSLFGSSKAYGAPVLKLKTGDILFLNDLSNDSLSGIYKDMSCDASFCFPNKAKLLKLYSALWTAKLS